MSAHFLNCFFAALKQVTMRAVTRQAKALDALTQPHDASAKVESPCPPWLMPSSCPDEPLTLCLAQPVFVPAPIQLLKGKWMYIPTPSFVPTARNFFVQ